MTRPISENQARDGGLAVVLILLLLLLAGAGQYLLYLAIFCLVLVMTVPALFTPWARLWFGFSALAGSVVSKVLLAAVFVVLAVSVGFLRRLGGADPMRRKLWKKGRESVFTERQHLVTRADIEHPY